MERQLGVRRAPTLSLRRASSARPGIFRPSSKPRACSTRGLGLPSATASPGS
jgi:hypothetical protein